MGRAISPETAETLRAVAERISGVEFQTARHGWTQLSIEAARVYVWAVYEGRDPARALGRWMFGAEYPLFDGDPNWAAPELRDRSRTAWAVDRVEGLSALRLNIPRAEIAA